MSTPHFVNRRHQVAQNDPRRQKVRVEGGLQIETGAVLLTSDEYRGRFGHADLGWTAFTRGGLTLVEIAEKHADVLRFQSVSVMAAIEEQLACRAL